jgi:predicted polyphosphate/ATP-dependent NAD kinase
VSTDDARIGLVVNPIAGLGGPAGLKGSDGDDIRERTAGRVARAGLRAAQSLEAIAFAGFRPQLLTVTGSMGANSAASAGWRWRELPLRPPARTTAADTRAAVGACERAHVDLILFAGGDGTAIEVLRAVGDRVPVIGIPAGVKMHSGAFALSAAAAGSLAARFLMSSRRQTFAADVLDLDEEALRRGELAGGLRGVVQVPAVPELVQNAKVRSPAVEGAAIASAARAFVHEMKADATYVIGPGTTTGAILAELGLAHTLLGVDVVRDHRLVAVDVDDHRLVAALGPGPVVLVLTPVGGQGFLLGRGDQQIGPPTLERCGPDGIVVIATEAKLGALRGRPLFVDTGDRALDARVVGGGYVRVVVGEGRFARYPIVAAG